MKKSKLCSTSCSYTSYALLISLNFFSASGSLQQKANIHNSSNNINQMITKTTQDYATSKIDFDVKRFLAKNFIK